MTNKRTKSDNWQEAAAEAYYLYIASKCGAGLNKDTAEMLLTGNYGKPMDPDFSILKFREQIILTLRYGEGLTLQEISEEIGISKERVRQVILQSFGKMICANSKKIEKNRILSSYVIQIINSPVVK